MMGTLVRVLSCYAQEGECRGYNPADRTQSVLPVLT